MARRPFALKISTWTFSISQVLAIPHVHYMNVGSEPHVVSQIPAVVVGIFVDHDIVSAPVPVIAVAEIILRNRKVEAAEPEAARASPFDSKRVSLPESATKSSVLERMIDVVVRVVLPGIMPDPFVSAGVDVWGFGMAFLVVESASLFLLWGLPRRLLIGTVLCRGRGTGMWRWTACGDMSPADATNAATLAASVILRRGGNRNQQKYEEYSEKVFHFNLLNVNLEANWSCA
jgi:hypothetical protein